MTPQPYSKKVMELFLHPHNMGEIKNPDSEAEAGNPVCGDIIKLYLKLGKNEKGEEVIKDIKFQTYGCASAIASSSIVTDMVKGKTLKEALKVSKQEILKELGGLPPIKLHCSALADEALKKAIEKYNRKEANKK